MNEYRKSHVNPSTDHDKQHTGLETPADGSASRNAA
jgi:hypothetical protein